METSRMTIKQLDKAVKDSIYLQAKKYYRTNAAPMRLVELSDYIRSYSGIMNLEVFTLTHFNKGYIAEVDLPPALIDALAHHIPASE